MERSSAMLNRSTAGKMNNWISLLVWLDRMRILNILISIKIDRINSALFTIGSLLNMDTETIKRRLWIKVFPVLCFISDLTFFEQVTITSCLLILKFHTISEKILKKPIDLINLEALHFCISSVDELTFICFMSLSVQKCKFFKIGSNTRSFLQLGSLNAWLLLDVLVEYRCFSAESVVYSMRLDVKCTFSQLLFVCHIKIP